MRLRSIPGIAIMALAYLQTVYGALYVRCTRRRNFMTVSDLS
jgi:hypothetical protein